SATHALGNGLHVLTAVIQDQASSAVKSARLAASFSYVVVPTGIELVGTNGNDVLSATTGGERITGLLVGSPLSANLATEIDTHLAVKDGSVGALVAATGSGGIYDLTGSANGT